MNLSFSIKTFPWAFPISDELSKACVLCGQILFLSLVCDKGFSSENGIIIRCVFFFLSFGRESTTWPANNCLRIMVCSCVVPSKRVLLQIIFCSCVIATTFSRVKWQIASLSCQEVIKIWKQTCLELCCQLCCLSYIFQEAMS